MYSEEYCRATLEELKGVIQKEYGQKESLRAMLKEKISEIDRLNKENIELRGRVYDLQIKTMGLSVYEADKMKACYENGASLRELAQIYRCDKSTIKRHLMKMGVTIRK